MHILKTKLKDLLIIKSKIFKDKRGFFKETNKNKILKKKLILNLQNSLFTSNKPLKIGFIYNLKIKIKNLLLMS